MTLLIKWWREAAIAALLIVSLSAIHACSAAKEETVRIETEDRALAENQRRENEAKAKSDQKAYKDSVHAYQDQIAHLRDDTRIASIRVCPRASSPRAVSRASEPTAGTHSGESSDIPRETATDPQPDIGPAIDALVRECDDQAVRYGSLVEWINLTR